MSWVESGTTGSVTPWPVSTGEGCVGLEEVLGEGELLQGPWALHVARDAPVVCWPGVSVPLWSLLPWNAVGFVGDWAGRAPPGAAIKALVLPRKRYSCARGPWSPRALNDWLPVGGLLLSAVLTSARATVDSS